MEHDLELLLQVWKELKPHLIGGDIKEAADDFIHVLMEHGVAADDLLDFALDSELKLALGEFVEEEIEDEDEDEELDWDSEDD